MPLTPVRQLPLQRPNLLPDSIGGDGCVLLMPFNEGVGEPRDYSGFQNHGTRLPAAHPPAWVDGRYGRALSFDGVDDLVEVSHSVSLNLGISDFSIEFWLNYRGPTGEGVMATIINKTAGWSHTPGWFAGIVGGVGIKYGIVITMTNGVWSTGGTEHIGAYRSHDWYHVVCIRTGTIGRLYQNSVLGSTITMPGIGANVNNAQPLMVGHGAWGRINALIDSLCIYNRALSADEIRARYLGGRLLPVRTLGVAR